VQADRARAELPAVPDEVVVLPANVGWILLVPLLLAGHRRRERMVQERPAAGVVALEEREVEHPVEDVLPRRGQGELTAEVDAEAAEHTCDELRVAGGEEDRRVGLARKRGELVLRQELRDRRAALAVLVDDDEGEPLGAPLLRDLLEPRELCTRECLR